jgi:hypothetical protein
MWFAPTATASELGSLHMITIPFRSYGGTHDLQEQLTCYPAARPFQLILRDKQGFYGFIDNKIALKELRDLLTKIVEE